jgi:four helix bundle protein
MGGKNYRDLFAWQKAMDLVELVYKQSQRFPREEQFGLTAQIRRAAVSIPSNIAEGQGRDSSPEFARFLHIAHGSLREVETQILITERLGFAAAADVTQVIELASEVGRLINGLIKRHRPGDDPNRRD